MFDLTLTVMDAFRWFEYFLLNLSNYEFLIRLSSFRLRTLNYAWNPFERVLQVIEQVCFKPVLITLDLVNLLNEGCCVFHLLQSELFLLKKLLFNLFFVFNLSQNWLYVLELTLRWRLMWHIYGIPLVFRSIRQGTMSSYL